MEQNGHHQPPSNHAAALARHRLDALKGSLDNLDALLVQMDETNLTLPVVEAARIFVLLDEAFRRFTVLNHAIVTVLDPNYSGQVRF